MKGLEATQLPGNAGGEPSDEGPGRLGRGEEHGLVGSGRSGLAEIEKVRGAIGGPNDGEAASTDALRNVSKGIPQRRLRRLGKEGLHLDEIGNNGGQMNMMDEIKEDYRGEHEPAMMMSCP